MAQGIAQAVNGLIFTNNWFEVTAKSIWDDLIPKLKPTKILEIGSYEGASTCYLIANCASVAPIEIHCIDTWEGGVELSKAGTDMKEVERRFQSNMTIARNRVHHKVELVIHRGPSNIHLANLLSNNFQNYFDLIYIDGSHQAPDVIADAVMSFPLLRIGGTMIFDDYLFRSRGDLLDSPKPAVDAFLSLYFRKMMLLDSKNSQVVARKTAT